MANKSLGQHWLYDPQALQAVIEAADVTKSDIILEVGPGHGTLTQQLVNHAKQVMAVEIDEILAAELKQKVKSDNLEVIQGDIIEFDLDNLPTGYKVAANIPYYLTSPIIMKFLKSDNKPMQIGLLVQKEVAQRLAAKPGALSVLGVAVQALADIKLGPIVPAKLFKPAPKVDSQIVSLTPRPQSVFPDHEVIMKLVRAGFLNRRKTLVNSLASTTLQPKTMTINSLIQIGLKPNIRAQELNLDNWIKLQSLLAKAKSV